MKAKFKGVCRLCRMKIIPGQNICRRDKNLPMVHTICENRIVKDEINDIYSQIIWDKYGDLNMAPRCVTCGVNGVKESMQSCDTCICQEV